jgi:Rha family phage regulatory protein
MKLTLNPEYKLYERKGQAYCTSRQVAEEFNKRHADVLRAIADITAHNSGVSEEFRERHFALSYYLNEQNKRQPEYIMTKDGFTLLAMSFTGKKAMKFKELYIKRFNEMDTFIQHVAQAKLDYPEFTDAIMNAHEDPQSYHYSNEADMINRIALGMSARRYRELHGIHKGESIRPYLTNEQIKMVKTLQRVDIGLILAIPDFEQRKLLLVKYFHAKKLK